MNTNQLKRFAQAARLKLIEQVTAKLNYVLTHDTAELRGKADIVKKIKDEINSIGKAALVDKVAYTWFNRLIALRFMDANGFQPLGYNVVTPLPSQVSPQILDEAHAGHISDELPVDRQRVLDILDGRLRSANSDNDAYRILLVGSCNHLSSIFPFLFERINDYTELLLPDDLTSNFSIVKEVLNGMANEDCSEVEVIGWLYQFYISQRKDEVFADLGRVEKEDIPAATQLFTPRWIVEYLVQNTLGKLWLLNRPNSSLRQYMPYFIEPLAEQSRNFLKVNSVEEIKLLDQACGSGHILVYAFELLTKIYEEDGYDRSEIPKLIIENNLYGFEIDERAAQLAAMALMMKARAYSRRFFKKGAKPNILKFQDLTIDERNLHEVFNGLRVKPTNELLTDLSVMQYATNLGSLIYPKSLTEERNSIVDILNSEIKVADIFFKHKLEHLLNALEQLQQLGNTFHCVVDNPPYMGGGNMNVLLSEYAKTEYQDGKADLSSCFILAAINVIKSKGYIGMVTLDSWMFLTSFDNLRELLLATTSINSMVHVGWNCFPQGHVYNRGTAFVLQKDVVSDGKYINLSNVPATVDKQQLFAERIANKKYNYQINPTIFKFIPGNSIGYWLKEKTIQSLKISTALSKYGKAMKGLDTCDNDRFVRFWYEVDFNKFSETKVRDKKWFIYQKGGDYRKWYGNIEKIVNWENEGLEIKNFRNPDGSQKSRPQNIINYFKQGITWSAVGSGETSYRLLEESIFGGGGNGFFPQDQYCLYLLGYLNSSVAKYFLELFNPTINNLAGDLAKLPVELGDIEKVNNIVEEILKISREYWYSTEIYWNLERHELLQFGVDEIEEAYDLFVQKWLLKYVTLHKLEEKLNQYFIELFSLEEELSPCIPLENVTILKQEIKLVENKPLFRKDEIVKQFISYIVGNIFGRYSIIRRGIIIGSAEDVIEDYFEKTCIKQSNANFIPDKDNVIPVLDDEWFEDDIVNQVHSFLKACFGEKTFKKNLAFIEESLGKDLRKYFIKDFYKDHVQRHKKRPIYWMFTSPKGYFNVLIYLHRYTQDTLNVILNDYLRKFIEKLELHRKSLLNVEVTGRASEQAKARKQIDTVDAMLSDCRLYELEILYPLASERLEIELDDGVLVNYNKFGKAVVEVDGLNDPKIKKKVKEFDWIDTTKIR